MVYIDDQSRGEEGGPGVVDKPRVSERERGVLIP